MQYIPPVTRLECTQLERNARRLHLGTKTVTIAKPLGLSKLVPAQIQAASSHSVRIDLLPWSNDKRAWATSCIHYCPESLFKRIQFYAPHVSLLRKVSRTDEGDSAPMATRPMIITSRSCSSRVLTLNPRSSSTRVFVQPDLVSHMVAMHRCFAPLCHLCLGFLLRTDAVIVAHRCARVRVYALLKNGSRFSALTFRFWLEKRSWLVSADSVASSLAITEQDQVVSNPIAVDAA
jgi:hypothetical protein